MAQILQVIVNAISLSLIYILFATGLTLIMGIFDVCNFAYGEFVMAAGFVTYFVVVKWGLPYIIAPFAAMVVVSLLGIIFEKGIFYPMRNRGGLEPALATFGSSSILTTAALVLFGGMPHGVPAIITGQFKIGSASVPNNNLPVIFGGLLMIALLFLFVQKTKLGLAIRALQQDQDAAALQGINIASTRIVIWVVASCLAAAAGVLLSSTYYVTPTMGSGYLLKGFAVVIIGGLGSIPGALIGGFVLGFVDSFGQTYLGSYSYMFAFAFIMLILIVRPQGLMGKR
ncbi:MAG: branched-chain amino acid ABC transporter permease [Dehalococcoidales bacterium]